MQNALYYPGFEVQDVNWLKFALLYVDVLRPIIPPRAVDKRGDLFQYLRGATDLIQPYPPDYLVGAAATLDAIGQVERVLRQPRNFASVFHSSDVTSKWRNSDDWNYELFREKYSGEWASFCLENGLGRRTENGLIVEASLGLLFMSILADVISDLVELPTLTDNSRMSDISILTRRSEPLAPWSVFIASHIIDLQLPIGLDQIPLEIIVAQRNKPDFKKKLHAFHNELRKYIQAVEDGTAEGDFFKTQGIADTGFFR